MGYFIDIALLLISYRRVFCSHLLAFSSSFASNFQEYPFCSKKYSSILWSICPSVCFRPFVLLSSNVNMNKNEGETLQYGSQPDDESQRNGGKPPQTHTTRLIRRERTIVPGKSPFSLKALTSRIEVGLWLLLCCH